MDTSMFPRYSWLDFVFTVIGVCTYVFDVGSDLWLAQEFLRHGHFFWFGLLIGFMLTSSVTVQMFSWFWLKYDLELKTFQTTHKHMILFGSERRLRLTCFLHVFQLGFFFRHVSAIWQGFCVWWRGERGSEYAAYLTHDLSMLRLIETFCESIPQLSLMIYIMIHSNHARTIQYVSAVASTISVAWMVVDYHRALRFFLPEKTKQTWLSSAVYFLWNLLLIGPRVVCVSLFTSVLSCYVFAHFLSLWLVFVLWASLQDTKFMDSKAGEWLYRATVGVIWYFSWFNVVEGRTRGRSAIYHMFVVTDSAILTVTWWCYRDLETSQSYSLILLILIPLSYLTGLLVKMLYYCCFHPKLGKTQALKTVPDVPDDGPVTLCMVIETDSCKSEVLNKRMARHAANFYNSTRTRSKGRQDAGVI
ncbi:XK-related protein 8.3 [Ictalurus furcatus]|uniref:XK-related protein 8.3 n=1 Tax=Ictalurus furcatus TaxID=66913 RepID=UPI0023504B46|nr:XK-related protein 8.3 [Ictalurus furcatus]